MAKYLVYGLVAANIVVGKYDAESEQEAIEKSNNDKKANYNTGLCNQCSDILNIGDVYELQAEEIQPVHSRDASPMKLAHRP